VNLTDRPSAGTASDLGLFGSLSTEMGDGKQEKGVGTLRAVSGSEGDDAAREGDDPTGGPRPDPLDRPWVHPSELRSYVANPLPPSQARPREWVIGLVSATVGVAATLLVLVAFGTLGERTRSPLPPPVFTGANTAVDYGVAARVSQFVSPSVVTVRATTPDGTNVASGVAVSSNRVLASAHVVVGATAISVSTTDGRTITNIKIMGSDADTDLVLLDVPVANLTFPPLATAAAKVGDPVVAVASTKGNSPYNAIGIISRLNLLVTTSTNGILAGLLGAQLNTTAETTGGGLFDTNGELVGILTSPPGVATPGLAVPIGVADDVRDQIESSGKVTHGWLGLTADDTSDRAGATVTAVIPGSPAAAAKLEVGDVITQAGSQVVGNSDDLIAEWRRHRPGDSIRITYQRGHSAHADTTATLTGPSPPAPTADTEPSPSNG
jgi:putative serine protease PepD